MSVVTETIEVEFYGGPADGMQLALPAAVAEWSLPAPAMTPAQFIALESGAPDHSGRLPVLEHRYVRTHYFGRHSGRRLFTYAGARRAR